MGCAVSSRDTRRGPLLFCEECTPGGSQVPPAKRPHMALHEPVHEPVSIAAMLAQEALYSTSSASTSCVTAPATSSPVSSAPTASTATAPETSPSVASVSAASIPAATVLHPHPPPAQTTTPVAAHHSVLTTSPVSPPVTSPASSLTSTPKQDGKDAGRVNIRWTDETRVLLLTCVQDLMSTGLATVDDIRKGDDATWKRVGEMMKKRVGAKSKMKRLANSGLGTRAHRQFREMQDLYRHATDAHTFFTKKSGLGNLQGDGYEERLLQWPEFDEEPRKHVLQKSAQKLDELGEEKFLLLHQILNDAVPTGSQAREVGDEVEQRRRRKPRPAASTASPDPKLELFREFMHQTSVQFAALIQVLGGTPPAQHTSAPPTTQAPDSGMNDGPRESPRTTSRAGQEEDSDNNSQDDSVTARCNDDSGDVDSDADTDVVAVVC
ncbi:hypothetical protein PTSG_07974 [Salpingoeca rosetta]|uniref:Myb/SANT-like domain-containing protein n=1 Tax=Salpingoeca rosetta (strain ATCC 50818 / BSB-021) TaxID=946362 RepID=F2UGV9_SALR5|nr:uncharacterized protein PTSG_07974 [Salpingoeca rosetta]EGD75859.1 hypothetical protein PTSG_07974 [Salpingoeca rosetta]|eukprot:XP_004991780.1 hypothetical protein PTSG_07974 [Salpingoeca rosetta]